MSFTFWSGAFWLLPAALAALLLLRFYRTRRLEFVAGSLLLWRRLAAQQPKLKPKRVIIDLAFLLQALIVLAIVAALSAPVLSLGDAAGRAVVLVIDNGPLARVVPQRATSQWNVLQAQASQIVRKLAAHDRVFLVRAAPQAQLLNAGALFRDDALSALDALRPALSGPGPEALLSAAVDVARDTEGGAERDWIVVSSQRRPAHVDEEKWICLAPPSTPDNVGILAFGSTPVAEQVQVLVRLKNFGAHAVTGEVILEKFQAQWVKLQAKALTLDKDAEEAVVFTLAHNAADPIRVLWRATGQGADAFPDDDQLVAVPRKLKPPRVRLHGSAPALEKLYKDALQAEILPTDSQDAADLEIYVRTIPERVRSGAKALMLLAPESGYRVFDVGDKALKDILTEVDERDSLTEGLPQGALQVSSACEILPGNYRSLVKDARSGRTLVASFVDEDRLGYLLAFVPAPDAGMSAQAPLDWDLAAMLVRMALQAAGCGQPYELKTAAELEGRSRQPLPADWLLTGGEGGGLLNEDVSRLPFGQGGAADFDLARLNSAAGESRFEFAPWLALLALCLACLELWLDRRSSVH